MLLAALEQFKYKATNRLLLAAFEECKDGMCNVVCVVNDHGKQILILEVMTERCENLASRLRVGLLCSMIQLSPLSGRPQQITDELTMQVDSVPWQLTSHLGWALAWE